MTRRVRSPYFGQASGVLRVTANEELISLTFGGTTGVVDNTGATMYRGLVADRRGRGSWATAVRGRRATERRPVPGDNEPTWPSIPVAGHRAI